MYHPPSLTKTTNYITATDPIFSLVLPRCWLVVAVAVVVSSLSSCGFYGDCWWWAWLYTEMILRIMRLIQVLMRMRIFYQQMMTMTTQWRQDHDKMMTPPPPMEFWVTKFTKCAISSVHGSSFPHESLTSCRRLELNKPPGALPRSSLG